MEHQIWQVLEFQGRNIRWLAGAIGKSEDLLYAIKVGRRSASSDVRAACARVLGVPEELLFAEQEPAATA